MKTTFPVALALVGACTTTTTPPVDAPPIASAKPQQMPERVAEARACMTRYEYTELGISFDCPTTLVGGDPNHFVTTCHPPSSSNPRFFPPPDTDEIQLDAAGHVVRQIQTYQTPPNGWHAVEDTVQVYTADGLFQEVTARDGNGTELFHRQVESRDAAGRAVAVSLRQIPIDLGRGPILQTGSSQGVLAYDANGRLVDEAYRFTSTDHLYLERSIDYDDAEWRRDVTWFSDFVGVAPEATHSDTIPAYEQLDGSGNLIELAHFSDPPTIFDYTYDDQGRMLTSVWTDRWRSLGRVIHYIYDCP